MKEIFIFSLIVGVSLSQQNRRYSRRQETTFHIRKPSPILDPFNFDDNRFVDPIFRNRQMNNVPGFHSSQYDSSKKTRKVNSNGGSYIQLLKRKWLSSTNRVRQTGPLPTLPPVPTYRRTKYVSAIKTPSYTPSPLDVLPKRRPSYLPTVRGVNLNTFPSDNNPFQGVNPTVPKPKYISNHMDTPSTEGILNPLNTEDNYVSNKDYSISQKNDKTKIRKNTNQGIQHKNPIVDKVPIFQETYENSVQKQVIHPVQKIKDTSSKNQKYIDVKPENSHTNPVIHSVKPILTASTIEDVISNAKPISHFIGLNRGTNEGQITHVNNPQDSRYQKGVSTNADTVSPEFTDTVAPVENGYIKPVAQKHVNPPSETYTGTFLPDTNINTDKTKQNVLSHVNANFEDPIIAAPDVLSPINTKDSNYDSGITNPFPDGHFVDTASSAQGVQNPVAVQDSYVDSVSAGHDVQIPVVAKNSNYDNNGNSKVVPPANSNYVDPMLVVPDVHTSAAMDSIYVDSVLAGHDAQAPVVAKNPNYDNNGNSDVVLPVDSNYVEPVLSVPDVHISVAADGSYADSDLAGHDIQTPIVAKNSNYDNNGNSKVVPSIDSNYVDPVLGVPDVHTSVAVDGSYVDSFLAGRDAQTPVDAKNSNYDNNGNSDVVLPVESNYVDPVLSVPDVHTSVAADGSYVDSDVAGHDIQTPVVAKNSNYDNNGNFDVVPPVDSNYVDPVLSVPDVHTSVAADGSYVDQLSTVPDVLTPVVDSNYENIGNKNKVAPIDGSYIDPLVTKQTAPPPAVKKSSYDSGSNNVDTFIMAVPNIESDLAPPVESTYDGTSKNTNTAGLPANAVHAGIPEKVNNVVSSNSHNPVNTHGNPDSMTLPRVFDQPSNIPDLGILHDLGLHPNLFSTFDQHTIIASNSKPKPESTDPKAVATNIPSGHLTSSGKKLAIPDSSAPLTSTVHNKDVKIQQVVPIVEEPFAENPWGPTAVDPVDHFIDAGIPHPPVGGVVKGVQTSSSGKENHVKDKPFVKTATISEPKHKVSGGFLSDKLKQHNHADVQKVKPDVAPVDNSAIIDSFNKHTVIDPFPTSNGVSNSEPGSILPGLPSLSLEPVFPFPGSTGDAAFPQTWSPDDLGISPFDNPAAFDSHFDQHFPPSSVKSTTNKPQVPRNKSIVPPKKLSTKKEPINNANFADKILPIVDTPAITRPTASNIQDAISRIGNRVRGATGAFDPRWDNPLVPSNRTGTYVDPKPLPPVNPSIGNPEIVHRLFEGQSSVDSAVTDVLNKVSSRTLELAEERLRRRQQQQQRGYPSKYHALRAFEG